MWPAVIIAFGILILLHQMHGGRFYFGNTWPAILMVIGLLLLASSLGSREGHVDVIPGAPPQAPPAVPPAGTTQTPQGSQGQ